MRKKILAGIVILSLVSSLMACGESEAQKVETTPDTPVVEEAKAEPEPEPEPVVEEKEPEEIEEEAEEVEEEPEKDYSWVNTYIDYLNHLDYSEGFNKGALIYVNDDFIPEIILQSHSDENLIDYSSYRALTINEDEVEALDLYGNNELSYLHRDNKLLMQLYHLTAGIGNDDVYSIVDNKWHNVFKGEYDGRSALEPDAEPNSAVTIYYVGKEVSEEEYYSQLDLAYDESKSEIVDFKYSIDELKQELVNFLKETTADKYNDAEPWKLTYRDLLYDFMAGVRVSVLEVDDVVGFAFGDDKFMLKDINDDGFAELLIGGRPVNAPWLVYGKESKKLQDYSHFIYGFILDTGELLTCGYDIYNQSYCGSIESVDGKMTTLLDEDFEDGEYDETTGTWHPTYPHHYYFYEEIPGKEGGTTREATEEEAKAFMEKWDKYRFNDGQGIKITVENIDKALLSTGDVTGENEEEHDDTNTPLYPIEVTAPDGYVNLRNGAGTDNAIITSISNGETLLVYEEANSGKWLKVEYQGNEGWVAASQVTKK